MRLSATRTAILPFVLLVGLFFSAAPAQAAPGAPCSAPVDVVACENSQPGTSQDVWDVAGEGSPTIQGFATKSSIDHGESISFKVKTDAPDYKIEIYRIGWYGGNGARLVDTINPSASLPQDQPACLQDANSGMVDCGNWGVSATWNSPADAVSGVYLARLVRTDTGGASHILFVVRDDERHADMVVQTSDETWQAYNNYGGNSLYAFSSGTSWWSGRGYKVSYNRPVVTRENDAYSSFFSAEYPMVRWLERNGYDVSYIAGIDTTRRPQELLNHKVFISSGHDEYWSGEQRANVEAARDAGVNLAFFSGNEMFWKTRWEPSIDGSNTADRTLVTYKESYSDTRLDPTGIWTGSWRDARFSPPADGGRPENAVTGTLFMVNAWRSDPIEIPARFGKDRIWRNTSIANLAAGTKATLPAGVLGYEWDIDADNGARPAGLIRMSSTTIDLQTEYLLNQGTVYGAGTATHSLNLYRAASGALVFGAGTVRWAWGLDGRHDDDGPNQDPRMQQATVNLFADMGVQPSTRQSNLLAATASTDHTPPTTTITGPASGTSFARNTVATITGTAQDTGGGVVGGVEVSTDGGQTWHYASGQENWTYSWRVSGFGNVDVRARAADDSANLGPSDSRTYQVSCPCTVWPDTTTPATAAWADSNPYELGFKFRSTVSGYITGLRFYKGSGNSGTHLGHLWSTAGVRLGEVTFSGETATGWQTASFSKPIAINANQTYIASYYAPNGNYALDRPFFTQAVMAAPLRALADGEDGPNAVFKSGSSGFPTQSQAGSASNYWVDVVFDQDGTDRVPPNVTATAPAAGDQSAPISANITATFDEDVDPASVTSQNFVLKDSAGATVPSTVSWSAANRQAVLDPTAILNLNSNYTVTLKGGAGGIRDTAGNTLSADKTWTFKTFSCPCSLWSNSATPQDPNYPDTISYELGVKFRADISGYVTGIRFYKGSGNTGTHLGHLWTSTGTSLGEVRFTNETTTGWQQAMFATPIPINAGTTYIASYYDPNGRYALDRPGFANARTSGPLRALADGEDGGQAVFKSGTSGFPFKTNQSSNYWVDLVFAQSGADTVGPTVLSTTPTDQNTAASTIGDVVATLDEAVDPATVSSSTMELRTTAGALVPSTVRYDANNRQAILDPTSPLASGTTYRVTLKGGASGVKDITGNPMTADYTWAFTTYTCPCSLWPNTALPAQTSYPDFVSYELGVRFKAEVNGVVTGIRFYKGSGNTGTHLGHVWTSAGSSLGEVTFTNETATGWQTASFATPIPITAGQTYVASYYSPNGQYALDRPGFNTARDSGPLHAFAHLTEDGVGNGVFKSGISGFPFKSNGGNYWVDLVFSPTG